MTLELNNTSYYEYDTDTDLFISVGKLTGDYIFINDFTRRRQDMTTIFCLDTKQYFIIGQ